MSMTAIIPIKDADALNLALAELGHGQGNLSVGVRVKPGTGPADHMAAHDWNEGDTRLHGDLVTLQATFPDLAIVTEAFEADPETGAQIPVSGVNFGAAIAARGMERVPDEAAL